MIMKRCSSIILSFAVALSVVLPLYMAPAFADYSEEEHLDLDAAIEMLSKTDNSDQDITEKLMMLQNLKQCEGLFVQERSNSTGNAYTANVSFYLKYGVPFCAVDYSNYSGVLDDAEVVPVDAEDYKFHSEPIGHFYSRDQQFQIDIGEQFLHIAWGDSCDFILSRGTGAVSDYENTAVPFDQTDMYPSVLESIDTLFSGAEHRTVYDADSREVTTYFMVKEGLFDAIYVSGDLLKDQVDSLLETIIPYSAKIRDVVNLGVREGINDFKKGHYSVILVDHLKDNDKYQFGEDIIFQVTDGEMKYSLFEAGEEENSSVSTSSQTSVMPAPTPVPTPSPSPAPATPKPVATPNISGATMGERNALQSAKEYLAIMPFSYSGLIEQLEYEGYTYSEAKYAADHCGADWNQQAAKSAREYLNIMAFSRQGLIEQLEYEGYTHSQAVYGVEQNGY